MFSDLVTMIPPKPALPIVDLPKPRRPKVQPRESMQSFLQSVTEPSSSGVTRYELPVPRRRYLQDEFEEEYRKNRYGRFAELDEYKGLG